MANSVVPAKLFCHHPFRIAQIQTHEEKNERERERSHSYQQSEDCRQIKIIQQQQRTDPLRDIKAVVMAIALSR